MLGPERPGVTGQAVSVHSDLMRVNILKISRVLYIYALFDVPNYPALANASPSS